MWLYHRGVSPNDADGIANSVDPDQIAPVLSGSVLFDQTCLSENLRSLRETVKCQNICELCQLFDEKKFN